MTAISVQLYGAGEFDGRVLTIPPELHASGQIEMRRPPRNTVADIYGGSLDDADGPAIVLFRWDGTVNEEGHARYRCTA